MTIVCKINLLGNYWVDAIWKESDAITILRKKVQNEGKSKWKRARDEESWKDEWRGRKIGNTEENGSEGQWHETVSDRTKLEENRAERKERGDKEVGNQLIESMIK